MRVRYVDISPFMKTSDSRVSREIFLIYELLDTEPETSYLLKTTDFAQRPLRGSFLESSLIATNKEEQAESEEFARGERRRLLLKEAAGHRPTTRSAAVKR